MAEIRQLVDFLAETLDSDERFILVVAKPMPGVDMSTLAYGSTLKRSESAKLMKNLMASWIKEPRVFGNGLDAIGDDRKLLALEQLDWFFTVTERVIPRKEWAAFLLPFVINDAHDQGITQGDLERAVAECIDEEFSTGNTQARVAVDQLLERTKPQG